MMGLSLAYNRPDGEIEAIYLPFFHEGVGNYDFGRFRPILQKLFDNKPTVYHNAKFDLVSLATRGLDVSSNNFYCTMLLVYQVGETRPFSKGLDSCGKYFLDDPGKRMKGNPLEQIIKAIGWERVPALLMADYAAYDAHLTHRLFQHIWPKIVAEGTEDNWKHRREIVRLIIKMEANGVRIDTDLCEEMIEKGEREMERNLRELGGLNPMSVVDLPVLLIENLGLPEILVDRPNGTRTRSFDKKAMEIYEAILERRNDRTARQILEYRGWQKSVSSNYRAYLELLSSDGRLRPNYLLHRTKTGRFSCEKPNLQQIPKGGIKPWNGQMKQCFIPREGYVLIEGDYSQLEFRLAAAYAKQQSLLDIFNIEGSDIFKDMSTELNMDRQDCKTRVYSMQYGAGARRISMVAGISMTKAKEWIDDFYAQYPNLRKVSKQAEWVAKKNGKIKLWSGRYRHFDSPRDEAYKAFNSVIQGGAADIVERTMLRCSKAGLNNDECRMLLQIHDSIVFEIREDLLPMYLPQIKHTMQDVTPDFGVKFFVDTHPFHK